MGKKLIIKGADFSANALPVEREWITVLEGNHTGTTKITYYDLTENIPSGTNVRLTLQMTMADLSTSSTASNGAKDSEGNTYNKYFGNNLTENNLSATYEKTLDITLAGLGFFLQRADDTLYYKLEAYM